jgi:hypothetical protein
MQKYPLISKGLVVGIILLFVGTSAVPGFRSIIEKSNNISTVSLHRGLKAYWSFNEGNGTILHDNSGNGYNGAIHGATWTTGISGGALSFDGGNDDVEFSSPVLNTPPYSVCAWVKASSLPAGPQANYIVDNGGQSQLSFGFALLISGEGRSAVFEFEGQTPHVGYPPINKLEQYQTPASPAGVWYFLVGTFDSSIPDSIKLYVNGSLKGTSYSYSWYYGPNEHLCIGVDSSSGEYFFHGIIDEMRLYNRVLNDDEIQYLYNHPDGGENHPPNTPTITGPVKGKLMVETTYNFTATDPDNDNVSYFIDWGDNTNTGWFGPYQSGASINQSHTWLIFGGTYTIKAKVKDIYGFESDWGTLSVTMPLSCEPPPHLFLLWLFERFPHAFPILRSIFGFNT